MSILYSRIARHHRSLVGTFLVLWFASSAHGQVSPSPYIPTTFFNNSGQVCSGCNLYTYESGTTTPLVSYQDAAGTVPNSDPIVLTATGRAIIFLTSAAYTLQLTDRFNNVIWSVDGITPSNLSLLASNNVWTGTNTWQSTSTFNGPTNFNVGFTSSGPNNLGGGGSISGDWTGSPVFQGTPFFNDGFMVNHNATFNGAIISTVPTGNAPFQVASSTVVTNLDADLLDGNDWDTPAAIGGTTPQTGVFTQLRANTSFQLGLTGPTLSSAQGTDTHLPTSGTFTGGTGTAVCKDANGGITTVGCAISGITHIDLAIKTSNCTTTDTHSYWACSDTLTWSNGGFPDATYVAVCSGQNVITMSADNQQAATLNILSQTTSTITVYTQSQRSTPPANFITITCIGMED